jgi:hypothetical protein
MRGENDSMILNQALALGGDFGISRSGSRVERLVKRGIPAVVPSARLEALEVAVDR